MIHAIRKLAREVHRRSVWQVVTVYALLAWVAVAGADRLTVWGGLPSWTPSMTLLLLLALLPFVVATAVVQNGIPGLRIEDGVDPNELPGLTPEQVHVLPEAHPLHRPRALTWRNTLLGGVTGLVLLAASVVAYLTMWALGLGPVGSLLAQGVIREGDPVAVATFTNLTEDGSLGALISDIVELDLMQSDVVTVIWGGDPWADATVVVDGDVSPANGGYAVSARIVLSGRGVSLARYREVAAGSDDLLGTIEIVSERVREKLGESLRSARGGARLEGLNTASAEALRLFGLASRAAAAGDYRSAVELLEQTLVIDDGFVLAWRSLGAVQEQAADTARALDAYRRVVDLWPTGGGSRRTVRELTARIAALEG